MNCTLSNSNFIISSVKFNASVISGWDTFPDLLSTGLFKFSSLNNFKKELNKIINYLFILFFF